MELVDVSYEDRKANQKVPREQFHCEILPDEAKKYLSDSDVSLETDLLFMSNAFLLTEVFHELMAELETDAITVNNCMGTIMGVSETTACMPLSFLNDAGYMAFVNRILW